MSQLTAVVDGHVHLHRCYEPDVFFETAYTNLSSVAASTATGRKAIFLLMTECAGDDYFGALHALGGGAPRSEPSLSLRRWRVTHTNEAESVVVTEGTRRVFALAGCQIACQEGLEVLVIGTRQRLPDGKPIRETLDAARKLGVPHVVPWGTGKWFFKRGRLLSELLRSYQSPLFFLGDEGGRPVFWPYPKHFKEAAALGVRDLPGTDPLPFPHDLEKVGRMGFRIAVDLDERQPARSLLAALARPTVPLERFATLEPPTRFIRNQIAMQLRKRRSA